MIDIYKASAGSGKTYTLSKTYLDLLLKSNNIDAYRNILAVTFTNKATEEMKSRILEDLAEKGEENSREGARARELLIHILHDYSAFSVSTIDKFFQQTIRSFTRELGQESNYQIELNKSALLQETVDRILDELKESDKDMLKWFTSNADEDLKNGEKPTPEKKLTDFAGIIDKGNFIDEGSTTGLLSQEQLKKLKDKCNSIIDKYHKDVMDSAIAFKTEDDTYAVTFFEKKRNTYDIIKDKDIEDKFVNHLPALEFEAARNLQDCLKKGSDRRKEYNTAVLLRDTIFSLGMADRFLEKFREIEKEKNILCLSQTTKLLSDIIDGSDAPFVYEKTGVRYRHFLLDEFQDTSHTQWDNFKPLLANSVSENNDNLIVGDIKQSIYRWRNSDWELLHSRIESDFNGNTQITTMQDNWRSNSAIVNFNNDFFTYASHVILPDPTLYSDVKQNVKVNDGQEGYVTVDYCDAKDENHTQIDLVLKYIEDAIRRGAKPSDIGILLRTGKRGEEIAKALLDAGYSIVSDDSLSLNSSSILRLLISLFYSIDDPDNTLAGYVSKCRGISIQQGIAYHSLVDLADRLLALVKDKTEPEEFDGQTVFINSFMDALLDWTQQYGNDLHQFLAYWEDRKEKLLISSPEDPEAIRLMTVHKSKGLAFPIVIFPYSDKVELFRSSNVDTEWCSLDNGKAQQFGIEEETALFPMELYAKLDNTFFSEAIGEEKKMQIVDNINLYYVCLTRARHELHIISETPAKSFTGKGTRKTKTVCGKMSEVLYRYCESRGHDMDKTVTFGEPYDYIKKAQEDSLKNNVKVKPEELVCVYNIHPMNPDPDNLRIAASSQSWDFFSEEGVGHSKRRNGIKLHEILSRVKNTDDLDKVMRGEDPEDADFLKKRILAHKEWFDPSLKVLNEISIIDPDRNTSRDYRRPDRVMIDNQGNVTVIDFKFGVQDGKHFKQVGDYMRFFTQMGYHNVRGYLWYVRDDKTVEVNANLL